MVCVTVARGAQTSLGQSVIQVAATGIVVFQLAHG